MKFPLYISRKYLFAKKSRNIIHLISGISVVVVAFVTAAMICVLSAFNGIEDLVKKLFANFDAPLTVLPREGKMFSDSLLTDSTLLRVKGVSGICRIVEEDAWLNYAGRNAVATIKGVDSNYTRYSTISQMIYRGRFVLEDDSFYYAVAGLGVRGELGLPNPQEQMPILNFNAPVRGKKLSRYRENAFNRDALAVSGIFSVNAELDSRYVIVPIDFARELFGMSGELSAVEVFLKPGTDDQLAKMELAAVLPAQLIVKSRLDKNALVYQTNASEKWFTFLILLFILVIASFNIIASLTMLIIEKKRDIFILQSMGTTSGAVKAIFTLQGIFINLAGAVAGTIIGLAVCLGQAHYGWLSMEGAKEEAYPVLVNAGQIILIFFTVTAVGSLFSAALVPSLVRRFAR